MDKRIVVGSALVFSLLSACGGGSTSGGGSVQPIPAPSPPPPPPPPPPTAFTSWQSIPSNGTLRVSGSTVEAPYTMNSNTSGTYGTISVGDLTADFTYASGSQTGIKVMGGLSNVSFTDGDGATKIRLASSPTITNYTSPSGSTSLFVVDAPLAGYSYMTYGAWTGKTTASSGIDSGFHGGSVTPAAAVPTTGSVTYSGKSVGYYSYEGGNRAREVTSDVTLAANFGARTLNFRSVGGHPMFGLLSYSSGSSMFSGQVTSIDPTSNAEQLFGWSGTLSGSFYGPGAQEVAGTFFMKSSFGTCNSGCQYVGAFGARRP